MESEAGLNGFTTPSTWSTPLSSAPPSCQHELGDANHNKEMTHPRARMEDGHDCYVPDADCTESIDAWAAGLWRLDEFDQALFDRDFTLYDSQDSIASSDYQQDTPLALPQQQSLATVQAHILHAPPITVTPPSSQGTSTTPARSISPPQRRQRAVRPRHRCNTRGCNKTFSRASDLDRHRRNVHCESKEYYECCSRRCLYRTRRKDKIQEHCQKVHAHTRGVEVFTVVPDDDDDADNDDDDDV